MITLALLAAILERTSDLLSKLKPAQYVYIYIDIDIDIDIDVGSGETQALNPMHKAIIIATPAPSSTH